MENCVIERTADCFGFVDGEKLSGQTGGSHSLSGGSTASETGIESEIECRSENGGCGVGCKRKFPMTREITVCGCSPSKRVRSQHIDEGVGKNEEKISSGEHVKNLQSVVKMRKVNRKRQPNINCRVEAFGRLIVDFDDVRKKWVVEMGFGGLLNIVGLTLPRTLCYWLMTRLDPFKGSIRLTDGREYLLTANHVRWVLGLPNGGKEVPRKVDTQEMRAKVEGFHEKYGHKCHGKIKKTGKLILSKGVTVTDAILERLKGEWRCEEEAEFKVLFLLVALYMILCPTQSRCLQVDLVPALTCAMDARMYDWCGLVLQKLIGSVERFSRKFDACGYAGGCGGCSLFVAIFYLDRLNRRPVQWGVWPRVQVWTAAELRKASQEDRLVAGGDFGRLETINAVYGEKHPFDSGDKAAPEGDCESVVLSKVQVGVRLRSRGRKRSSM